MKAVLDERSKRRARMRALAASIADKPRRARQFTMPEDGGIRASARRRYHGQRRAASGAAAGGASIRRRRIAAFILGAQLVGLFTLLFAPMFTVRSITVVGARLLTRDGVAAVAAVSGRSIFTIDGEAVRERLSQLPWVKSVAVTTELPATVRIGITEMAPVLRMSRGGRDLLVAADGSAVAVPPSPPASVGALPLLIDGRSGIGEGQPVVDSGLAQILEGVGARFPGAFGCSLAAYEWQPDGVLVVWAKPGWRAILGHVETPAEVAGIPARLAALAALRTQLDLAHPRFGYVDIENPEAPAAGGRPGLPPAVVAAIVTASGSPAAPGGANSPARPQASAASPSPSTEPLPTPIPTPVLPTPFVIHLPPPRP